MAASCRVCGIYGRCNFSAACLPAAGWHELFIAYFKARMKAIHLILVFILLSLDFVAQNKFPIKEWAKILSSKDDIENTEFRKISWFTLRNYDSATVAHCIRQLENTGESGAYFKAKISFLKAADISYRNGDISMLSKLCEQSLFEAYETGDDHLIGFMSFFYGLVMQERNELPLSTFFYLNADETYDTIKQLPPYIRDYRVYLGESMYRIAEYQKCIDFTKKGLDNYTDTSLTGTYWTMRYLNTIGQAYKQLGQLDSAMIWYQRSIQVAYKINDLIWTTINAVFIGEAWLLKKDHSKAKEYIQYINKINYETEPKVCAYGLQLLAKIDLINGQKDSAMRHIKRSLELLNNSTDNVVQKMDYLQYAYATAADVYRANRNTDSFYHYTQLYTRLHDSLQKVITLSSVRIAQLRINNEKNYQNLQRLKKEKQTEALTRNFIIAILIMLSLIAILVLNRQRQKAKHKEQLALQQKEVAEANIAVADAEKNAAMEQLNQFTQNLVEKTNLIEKLEQQLLASKHNTDQQQLIQELTQQTILTEDDWIKFKSLFEKTYPGFFNRLKQQASDITVAEQRMASLTRLHLTTRQMAAVLGISANSVIKAKQRLRQRFNLETDFHVESFIDNL